MVPIRDPGVLAKIHQTYRTQYIKDVILPRSVPAGLPFPSVLAGLGCPGAWLASVACQVSSHCSVSAVARASHSHPYPPNQLPNVWSAG